MLLAVQDPAALRSRACASSTSSGVAGSAQRFWSWVDWRFTTADARIKLEHLYLAIQG
jgi:hypothetical protein